MGKIVREMHVAFYLVDRCSVWSSRFYKKNISWIEIQNNTQKNSIVYEKRQGFVDFAISFTFIERSKQAF